MYILCTLRPYLVFFILSSREFGMKLTRRKKRPKRKLKKRSNRRWCVRASGWSKDFSLSPHRRRQEGSAQLRSVPGLKTLSLVASRSWMRRLRPLRLIPEVRQSYLCLYIGNTLCIRYIGVSIIVNYCLLLNSPYGLIFPLFRG